jgi:hypothetical protein
MFGKRNAASKASICNPAPKLTALMLSRISPVMREIKVSALTAESVLSRFMRGPVTLAGEASARAAICGHGARMRSHF